MGHSKASFRRLTTKITLPHFFSIYLIFLLFYTIFTMFILSLLTDPIKAVGFLIGLFLAISVHEFIHAFVADRLGDPTPRYEGRLSLNPLIHLDPWGTLFLLWMGFGWGKPVLINPMNFKNPREGEFLTAISGPLSNFVLASFLSIPLRFLPNGPLADMLTIIIYLNLMLCAFNILPIPPLDGSKILWIVFPKINPYQFEATGTLFLFSILIFSSLTGYPLLSLIIMPIINFLARLIGLGGL